MPVLSVIIALPYIDSRPLRFLIITCWVVTVAIALIGEFIGTIMELCQSRRGTLLGHWGIWSRESLTPLRSNGVVFAG